MSKLWDKLEGSNLLHALDYQRQVGLCTILIVHQRVSTGCIEPIVLMSDKEVMDSLREYLGQGEMFRANNIQMAQDAFDKATSVEEQAKLHERMEEIGDLTELECILNLPGFIRLCLELQDRGHDLADMFYDCVH